MKKINLIEWLWKTDSHEKQSPQRFARYAAMLIMLLTLGVGQMWAWTSRQTGTISSVYVTGDMNSWATDNANWALTKIDGNHWKGTFFIKGQNSDINFKLYINASNRNDYYSTGYNYHKDWTGGEADIFTDKGNASITPRNTSTSAYIKLTIEFYASYGSNEHGYLSVTQEDVSALSASMLLSPNSTTVQGGSTRTITASCTGGSGSYTYSYTVTCGGSNVTASVLNASNVAEVTFTAPMASTSKTYRVTVTATETNTQLTGLGFTSTNSTYTDITVPGITAPTVTMTVDKVNVNLIKVTGTITNYNGYGSSASDLSEVGFYIGATKYTATYKAGNTFTKIITGLAANTAYANVKAFATNPLATGYSSTQTITTLADATYRVKVRVDHNDPAPHLYAWRDAEYEDTGAANAADFSKAPSMSLLFAATTYDWYYYDVHNEYEKFIFYKTGSSDQTADFAATRTDDCYWYDESKGTKEARAATMTCPVFETQLVVKTGGVETQTDMTGSGTVTLDKYLSAGTHSIKVLYNTEYYGKASSSIARTGSTSSNAISGMVVEGAYITLTADLAGTYTFSFNTSTKALSVSYPEAYQVNFSAITVGGGTGSSAVPTASYGAGPTAVTSGTTWIPTGTTVNFSAKSANAGYTFMGWYSTNTPNPASWSTNRLTEATAYSPTINSSAVKTIYAVYDENDYTVTVTKTSGGSIASTSVTGHKSTKVTLPTATPDPGYYFTGWTTTVGSLTYTNQSSATAAQVNGLTAAATVQANFAPIWRITGGDAAESDPSDAMGNWSTEANKITTLTITDGVMKSGTVTMTLAANTEYHFKVFNASTNKYWGNNAGSVTKITYANQATAQTLTNDAGKNQTFRSAAAGTYTFTWDVEHSKVSITYPTSHKITYGGYKTVYLEGADGTTDGGTMRAVVSEVTINSGDYVSDGVTVNFYADETDGYHPDGWYNNADYADAHRYKRTDPNVYLSSDESLLQLTSVSEDKTLYLKYKENKLTLYVSPFLASVEVYDVGGSVVKQTIDGSEPIYVGVHTGKKLKVIPDVPYYFTGWELAETPKYNIYKTDGSGAAPAENEDYAEVNVYATSECTSDVATQTLHASCKVLNAIYFRNEKEDHTALWDSVYVGFNATWSTTSAGDKGGVKGASTKGKTVLPMEKISGNTWRVYIPRAITRAKYHNVAFFDKGIMRGWNEFYGNNAVYRTDFDNSNDGKLNMYVPYHVKSSTDNTTTYYSTGYWKTAYTNSVDAGYYLEHRYDNNKYTRVGTFVGMSDNKISYTLRLDNTSYKDYAIYDANGKRHIAVSGVTSTNYTDIRMNMDNTSDSKFGLTPTAEGNYVFMIDQSCDTMKLSVEFPVAVNDYVVENNYVGKNKAGDADSTYVTRSNVIKASDAETKTRYSMYISNAGGASATLKLRKCTSIDGSGNAVWSTGYADNLSGILSDGDFTPGVYQFDLTIDKSTDKVSEVDSLRLYTGNFYIKTDAADGGWVHYKRNILEKNTVNFDRTSATYDNYFCKYFASKDCNIKSVIANDYCNQLSDTVKGDGIARMEGKEPFVPVNGTSIRFSYNSATNETKRAYLGASANNDFLNIDVSTDDKIYRDITVAEVTTETDMYGISGYDNLWKTRFNDNGNWVYEMDVKVKPSGKAGVTAAYTDAGSTKHVQTLIPNTNTVLGGSESSDNKYSIRIVYDFKTNFMMSSFVLTETEIGENLSDFDMLWVRHKDKSATQLTLGTGKKLTNVRPIGAIEFRYDSVCNDASHSGTGWVDMHLWTPQNRPFLKYFVSFPFDVEVNSIFGLNQARYGIYYDYVIQKYNGAKRAKDGLFFGDDNNYWENVQPGDTLKANEGYCVIFDNEYVAGLSGSKMWENKASGSRVYLYFPAMKEVASITNDNTTTTVDPHTCTIDRAWSNNAKKNHKYTDSHWSLIGNPLFHDAYIKDFTNGGDSILKSYYYMDLTSVSSSQDWQTATVTKGSTQLKAMSSVLVQWFGTINWGTSAGALAAPRRTNDEKDYLAQLEIAYNGVYADQTFVKLSEEANTAFVLREDMCKVLTTARPNIYTFAGDYDVAYNEMPIESCTVPVGVLARRTGTYTFSMPKNFSGTVTLIDKFDGTRTNLAIEDYEVDLEKGTIDDRFELEINVNKMPTAIDGAEDGSGSLKDGKAHKFIENGVMYILENGRIYDAQGNRVK